MPHAETSRLSISVVIPTKDCASDLAQTLKCVRAQTRAPDELIVVDQSRAGDAREALAEYADLRPIHIRDTEIRGLPAARNVGFAASKGDLVCFFDDDVTLDPHYLAELERGFKLFPGWAGLTGRLTEEGRDPARQRLLVDHALRFGRVPGAQQPEPVCRQQLDAVQVQRRRFARALFPE